MTIVEEETEIVDDKKAAKKRPDGLEVDRYKNLKSWTYRRWAWEFLRRNPDFIKACETVEPSTDDEKLAVAQQFGLKKFKHYKEGFKQKSGQPIFNIGQITSIPNLESDAPLKVRISIGPGQVMVRFDLASAMMDVRALDKQLRRAKSVLNKRLELYAKYLGKNPDSHKPKVATFGIYIRLLDCLAAKKTPVECARIIFPNSV